MGFTIKKYETPDLVEQGARIANDNELYVYGWSMQEWYENPSCLKALYIGFYNKIPVAVLAIRFNSVWWKPCNCGTYVAEQHRRMKYGSRLITKAKKDGHELKVDKHDPISTNFFNSLKL